MKVFTTYLKIKIAQALALPILVGLILIAFFGAKFFGVPAPSLPAIPAFSLQAQASGGYAAGQGQANGSFAFSLGNSQTASQALSAPSLSHTATHTVASQPKPAKRLIGNRTWFNDKGKQLPTR